MKIKIRALGEFLEKELKKSIYIFGSLISIGGTILAIRIANIQRLVQEGNICLFVPGILVEYSVIAFLIDSTRSNNIRYMKELLVAHSKSREKDMPLPKFHKETGQRRATGPTIQPENEGTFRRLIPRFKEPKKEVFVTFNIQIARDLSKF